MHYGGKTVTSPLTGALLVETNNNEKEFIMNETIKATFDTKEQDFQNETTRYWFDVTGTDGWDGKYAIADCNAYNTLLDCEGCPINTCDDHHMTDILVACSNELEISGAISF